jgi:hypothetical protein
MVAEHVFVEEFHKELVGTGYPFTQIEPIVTNTGYALAPGWMADASIYCDSLTNLPSLTEITRDGLIVGFTVGSYKGTYQFETTTTANKTNHPIVELYSDLGLFGGILVLDREKIMALEGWKTGSHVPTKKANFCIRCFEVISQQGLLRFRTDSNELISGTVVLVGGNGTILELEDAPSGVRHVRVNFVGDPTLAARDKKGGTETFQTPLQYLFCTGVTNPTTGATNDIIITPNSLGGVYFIAQDAELDTHETLQFSATDTTITLSLSKKAD